MFSASCYLLISCYLRLDKLDLSGNIMICQDLTHFAAFWPFWRSMGDLWGPMGSPQWTRTNNYKFICIVLNITYLFEAIWGLNHLYFTGYSKIYPDFASLWLFRKLFVNISNPFRLSGWKQNKKPGSRQIVTLLENSRFWQRSS